jgi:hypothetical protein
MEELDAQLAALRRPGMLRGWHARQIEAGDNVQRTIDAQLDEAQIILLLVSADFLASDGCYDVELKRAMERHEAGSARVIPIILRACAWRRTRIGGLSPLPKDGTPVTSWENRDEALHSVVSGIEAIAEGLAANPL